MIKAEIRGNNSDGFWIILRDEYNNFIKSYTIEEDELKPILSAIKIYLER